MEIYRTFYGLRFDFWIKSGRLWSVFEVIICKMSARAFDTFWTDGFRNRTAEDWECFNLFLGFWRRWLADQAKSFKDAYDPTQKTASKRRRNSKGYVLKLESVTDIPPPEDYANWDRSLTDLTTFGVPDLEVDRQWSRFWSLQLQTILPSWSSREHAQQQRLGDGNGGGITKETRAVVEIASSHFQQAQRAFTTFVKSNGEDLDAWKTCVAYFELSLTILTEAIEARLTHRGPFRTKRGKITKEAIATIFGGDRTEAETSYAQYAEDMARATMFNPQNRRR